jgi:hypothetical protein
MKSKSSSWYNHHVIIPPTQNASQASTRTSFRSPNSNFRNWKACSTGTFVVHGGSTALSLSTRLCRPTDQQSVLFCTNMERLETITLSSNLVMTCWTLMILRRQYLSKSSLIRQERRKQSCCPRRQIEARLTETPSKPARTFQFD